MEEPSREEIEQLRQWYRRRILRYVIPTCIEALNIFGEQEGILGIICMGAEPLGDASRALQQQIRMWQNVDIRNLFLTRNVVGHASYSRYLNEVTVFARGLYSLNMLGYGRIGKNRSQEVTEYLKQEGITQEKRVIFLDTGYFGGIYHLTYQMLEQCDPKLLESICSKGFCAMMMTKTEPYGDNKGSGTILQSRLGTKMVYPTRQDLRKEFGLFVHALDESFPHSRTSPSQLVQQNGIWVPDTGIYICAKKRAYHAGRIVLEDCVSEYLTFPEVSLEELTHCTECTQRGVVKGLRGYKDTDELMHYSDCTAVLTQIQ